MPRLSSGTCVRSLHSEDQGRGLTRGDGSLRPVVSGVVADYLECGRLHGGFARLRCPIYRREHLLAFSCQTRNFCPSCQGEWVALTLSA